MIASIPLDVWLRPIVLVAAAAVVLIWARRWARGSLLSYLPVVCGIGLLIVGDALHLGVALHPGRLVYDRPGSINIHLLTHSGGYLLVLVGFILWARDVRRGRVAARADLLAERSRAKAARLEEAQLRAILNCATEYCIVTADLKGRITSCAAGGARILGWDADEVVGKMAVDLVNVPAQGPAVRELRKAVETKGYFETEVSLARKDGEVFPALLTVTPLTGPDGRLRGYVGIVKDITPLKRTQGALKRERDFIQGVIETSELFIVGVSLADWRVTLFNRGAERISGYRRSEVIGRDYAELFLPPEVRDQVRERITELAADPDKPIGHGENPIVSKSGQTRIISWTNSLSCDDQGRPTQVVVFGYDVTEQREVHRSLEQAKADLEHANAELKCLATTDELTCLANRRAGNALFEREVARSRRNHLSLGVVMIDLDYLKAVNDSYGHEVGDAVLKHVASLLRGRLRATDVLARYGGDEFLVLLPEADPDDAACVANMLLERLHEHPAWCGEIEIPVSASFGVAVLEPGQKLFAADLIRMADEALYAAKRAGGGRVATWDQQHHLEVEPRLAFSEKIRQIQQRVSSLTQHNHEAYLESMYRLVDSLEGRNRYTARHSRRVAQYGVAIARRMDLQPDQIQIVYRAAMLHDLGEVAIPDDALWKNGPLTQADWELVRQHPAVTIKIIGRLEFLRRETTVIRHHHERPDGQGYPDGQVAEAIPVEACILAVAEALDAMTCERPYRRGYALEEALEELRRGAGAMFDAAVVKAAVEAAGEARDWPLVRSTPAAVEVGAGDSPAS